MRGCLCGGSCGLLLAELLNFVPGLLGLINGAGEDSLHAGRDSLESGDGVAEEIGEQYERVFGFVNGRLEENVQLRQLLELGEGADLVHSDAKIEGAVGLHLAEVGVDAVVVEVAVVDHLRPNFVVFAAAELVRHDFSRRQ